MWCLHVWSVSSLALCSYRNYEGKIRYARARCVLSMLIMNEKLATSDHGWLNMFSSPSTLWCWVLTPTHSNFTCDSIRRELCNFVCVTHKLWAMLCSTSQNSISSCFDQMLQQSHHWPQNGSQLSQGTEPTNHTTSRLSMHVGWLLLCDVSFWPI